MIVIALSGSESRGALWRVTCSHVHYPSILREERMVSVQ